VHRQARTVNFAVDVRGGEDSLRTTTKS